MRSNLVWPRLVDKIAKTLTKSDVVTIKGPKAIDADHHMKIAFGIAMRLFEEGHIDQEKADELLGQCFMRIVMQFVER